MDDILKDNWSNTHDSISKQIKQRINSSINDLKLEKKALKKEQSRKQYLLEQKDTEFSKLEKDKQKKSSPNGDGKRLSELENDLDKDAQLRHAVSLLSGWDIIAETIKPDKQMDKSSHLSFDKF